MKAFARSFILHLALNVKVQWRKNDRCCRLTRSPTELRVLRDTLLQHYGSSFAMAIAEQPETCVPDIVCFNPQLRKCLTTYRLSAPWMTVYLQDKNLMNTSQSLPRARDSYGIRHCPRETSASNSQSMSASKSVRLVTLSSLFTQEAPSVVNMTRLRRVCAQGMLIWASLARLLIMVRSLG